MINYGSLPLCFYTLGGFQLVLQLPLLYGIRKGWISKPPSTEVYARLVAAGKADKEKGANDPSSSSSSRLMRGAGDDNTNAPVTVKDEENESPSTNGMNNEDGIARGDRDESTNESVTKDVENESASSANRLRDSYNFALSLVRISGQHQQGTAQGDPIKKTKHITQVESGCGPFFPKQVGGFSSYMYRSHFFYLLLLRYFVITYCGYTTKVLLSTMFVLIFNLPDMTAAYLSAVTLLLYLVGRALVPLTLMDRSFNVRGRNYKIPAIGLSCIASGVCSISYGLVSTSEMRRRQCKIISEASLRCPQ